MTRYACLDCGEPYQGMANHCCPACGGIFSIPAGIQLNPEKFDSSQPGIWRYRDTFGLSEYAPNLYLGEGETPLVEVSIEGRSLHLKMESVNPSGSFKDRLAAVMVSAFWAEGVSAAAEDSSGNAGAAFAAYCARAGINAKVFVPESATGPKRDQIARFGAEVVAVPGPRQSATDAVLTEVAAGAVYASHAFLPQGLTGVATIAYELVDQIGEAPGMVIAPVGHGGLLLGVILGFEALLDAGVITEVPSFIGVQAAENAPVWAAANQQDYVPGSTIAGGIAVSQPVRGPELIAQYLQGGLDIITVSEEAILAGRQELAEMGIDAEPTSAIIVDAYRQILERKVNPDVGKMVAIISGHGLKQ